MTTRCLPVAVLFAYQLLSFTEYVAASFVGVNYGLKGNNLPPPQEVVSLLKSNDIRMVRLFDPNPEVLNSLRGSDMIISIGMPNDDIEHIASNEQAAANWLSVNIIAWTDTMYIKWITIGNEQIPGPYANYVLPTMANMQATVNAAGLTQTWVTTVVATTILSNSYPPSAGTFLDGDIATIMTGIATFLAQNSGLLMVNLYPYFVYTTNPAQINLDYTLFKVSTPPVTDRGLAYYNLFDAMVDAFFVVLEKVGGQSVNIIVSETGWPTAGNASHTSIANAQVYNNNLKLHVLSQTGTPRRPNVLLDTFIFSLFNENKKDGLVEQNFDNSYPSKEPVYPLWD